MKTFKDYLVWRETSEYEKGRIERARSMRDKLNKAAAQGNVDAQGHLNALAAAKEKLKQQAAEQEANTQAIAQQPAGEKPNVKELITKPKTDWSRVSGIIKKNQ